MSCITIKTALPLPAQTMVQFFKDKKNHGFEIDYGQSLANLRSPKSVLQYLANLNVVQPSTLVVDKIPLDLLSSYITMRDACNVDELVKAHANILYFLKYGTILYPEVLDAFDYDDMLEFLKQNERTLIIQSALLNSIPLFVATALDADGDTDRSEHELVTQVDEAVHPEISVSLFNLFKLEDFLILYLERTVPIENQIYFKPHYDKPMYSGKTMFGWFAVTGNTYYALHDMVATKAETGVGRYEMVDLLASLIKGSGSATAWKEFRAEVDGSKGVKALLNLTNRDLAAINKMHKKHKKQTKKAL